MRQAVQALNGCVRPVVALVLALALVFLAVRGDITSSEFLGIVAFVLGYWFRARDGESGQQIVPHG